MLLKGNLNYFPVLKLLTSVMYVPVAEVYAGKSIFITGGTGFLGKVLVEKIIYSCPGVEKIYILLRQKKGENAEQRLQKMLDLPVYKRVKNERPKDLEKIIPISGDISEPKLGLTKEDEAMLIQEVSYVFHSAATVHFNEPLHVALNTNVKGAERILSLCRRMKKLQCLLHVSTCYSNTHKIFIEEKLYPPPISARRVDELIKEEPGEERTNVLIGARPNTYTFAKSVAETVIVEQRGKVPVVIVRPSIVTASASEPFPGWLDNWNGATSLLASVAKGVNRVIPGKDSNVLDLIPVDYVVNLMIVAAARQTSNDVSVLHSATSTENPLAMKELKQLITADSVKNKFNELPLPTVLMTDSKLRLNLTTALLQTAPALTADALLWMSGSKPRYKKMLSRITRVRNSLAYFTTHSWKFSTMRAFILASSLSFEDKETFPFSPSSIVWKKYIPVYCAGIRDNLIK